MPLSECVYWVVVTFNMIEQVKPWISIKFVLSLNIPLWKLFIWFRSLQLWATGDWQLHHNNMPAHISHLVQSFLVKHQITQVTQPSCSPGFPWLLAFPKTKPTFEKKEISDLQCNLGEYNGAADSNWENCVRSHSAYFEGDWGIIALCTMVLVSSSINVFIFHSSWLDTF